MSDGRATTSNLRRELSRVRSEFIMSTSNRSEQHSALLGGHRGGGNPRRSRPIPQGSRHASSNQALGQGHATRGGRQFSEEWAMDRPSPCPVEDTPVSRLGSNVFKEFRQGGSCNDVFVSRVDRIPTADSAEKTRLDPLRTGNGGEESASRSPISRARGMNDRRKKLLIAHGMVQGSVKVSWGDCSDIFPGGNWPEVGVYTAWFWCTLLHLFLSMALLKLSRRYLT